MSVVLSRLRVECVCRFNHAKDCLRDYHWTETISTYVGCSIRESVLSTVTMPMGVIGCDWLSEQGTIGHHQVGSSGLEMLIRTVDTRADGECCSW